MRNLFGESPQCTTEFLQGKGKKGKGKEVTHPDDEYHPVRFVCVLI